MVELKGTVCFSPIKQIKSIISMAYLLDQKGGTYTLIAMKIKTSNYAGHTSTQIHAEDSP